MRSNQLFSPGRGYTRLAWGFNPRLGVGLRLRRLGGHCSTRLSGFSPRRASRLGLKPQARRVSLLRSERPVEILR